MSEIDLQYDEIGDALRRMGVEESAAEVHGALCGLFCTVGGLNADYWLENSITRPEKEQGLSVDALGNESRSILTFLFTETRQQLFEGLFNFYPFLPDDDTSLATRTEALAHWCQGFLFGLSQGGMTDTDGLPGDLPEIVRDMLEISRADSFELEDEAQDEKDFMELVEYVRVGVQLFIDEMKQFDTAPEDDDAHLH